VEAMDEFLTAPEAAKILRVHPRTLLLWARTGRVTSVRLGSASVRFRRDDIRHVISGGLVEAQS
jgi:excisionase family DNA binding protein